MDNSAGPTPSLMLLDDDPRSSQATLRFLRLQYPQWHLVPASIQSTIMSTPAHCRVVVIKAAQLTSNCRQQLNLIKQQMPEALRVLLSSQHDRQVLLHSLSEVQLVLPYPVSDAQWQQLFTRLDRYWALPIPFSCRQLIGLLTLPRPAQRQLDAIEALLIQPNSNNAAIAAAIAMEAVLATRLVQMANSAYLGFVKPAQDIVEAVKRLGRHFILQLVQTLKLQWQLNALVPPMMAQQVQQQSLEMALLSSCLAEHFKLPTVLAQRWFMTAMVSQLGQLLLFTPQLQQAKQSHATYNPSALAAALLSVVGFDMDMVAAVFWQTTPAATAACIVHTTAEPNLVLLMQLLWALDQQRRGFKADFPATAELQAAGYWPLPELD